VTGEMNFKENEEKAFIALVVVVHNDEGDKNAISSTDNSGW
jgi:hypothetical protein